jgi:hypothetical protein
LVSAEEKDQWFADLATQAGYTVIKVLLYTGPMAFVRQSDGVNVIPIALLGH